MPVRFRRHARAGLILLLATGLGGCHYVHLLRGHYDLMSRRVPIAELLANAGTPDDVRHKLVVAQDARFFAVHTLQLPDNASYTLYADLQRPYVQWSVMAAPELSLKPKQWCFPVAGCVAYIGFYDREQALEEAQSLAGQGFDTHIGGVSAYSTLGWFDDPVLNTMLVGSDERLAGLIFHELAHQQLYASGDTMFNESLASFIEAQGLREFLSGQPERLQRWQVHAARHARVVDLMLDARARLEALYAGNADVATQRRLKQQEFERLQARYAELRMAWGETADFDGWFADGFNNARLLPFGLYHQWVPAFAQLYRESAGDWKEFHRRAKALADLAPELRSRALSALAGSPAFDESLTTNLQ